VELIVIGLEGLAWITLLLCSLFGLNWLMTLVAACEKAEALSTVVIGSLAYFVGIVVDEVCDFVLGPWSSRIRESLREKGQPEMWAIQAYVFCHSEVATEQLAYMRSRIRICRSSIFNAALTTLLGLVFLWKQSPIMGRSMTGLVLAGLLAGTLTAGVTAFVFWRIERAYWLRMREIYKSLTAEVTLAPGRNPAGATS
jgi:hypothetical protein